MINREFSERINDLRRELIDAIIAELKNRDLRYFVFPDDTDRSELPWQTITDKNGEPHNGWVTKIEICGSEDEHLAIYAEDEYISCTTFTSHNYEAKEIDFLDDLYICLQYYIKLP